MSRKKENNGFVCKNCGYHVEALDNGSYRNHCPNCLHSLHVDVLPGDRKSDCIGIMEPVDIIYNPKKGYQIIHKCKKCLHEQKNKIAENCNQSDNFDSILKILSKRK